MLPHPKKDLGRGLLRNIYKQAGWEPDQVPHYVAIVEDAGPDKAIGIWFPDLPGCFSAGDDVDEALLNAEEALVLYAEAEAKEGRDLPPPRPLSELRDDPTAAADLRGHMVALVALRAAAAHAAE